ncbi:hypothetical protein J1G43_02760 [Cellulomonas sp. zg-ZUI22]|uniref:hypothetical protein n=1 Tax=Cellulomonas sp. zg-ZUI22 TaxID=2816955 RepID=UPI001A93F469|nr:hypothetical protein [Cellulomonas sp. zg-ZUI22]MBO0898886.1 hypothetical protein [Cellulomonas sp. zg-ZUI22]
MSRLVEVCPEAMACVRADVATTSQAVLDRVAPLRSRMLALGVPTRGLDDAVDVAHRLDENVLPVVDTHLGRARALADTWYGGALGAPFPVVDAPHPSPVVDPFTSSALDDGTTMLSWMPAPVEAQQADAHATVESRGIGDWLAGTWDGVSDAVDQGVDWLAQRAVEAGDAVGEAGASIGEWWQSTTADLGTWVDENLAGVRELIGRHVAMFRVLADVCRVVGWVVVGIGAVLTVGLTVIGAMGGAAIGAVFGFGVGAVPVGGAGAVAGLTAGLKVLGVGFTLVAVGDLLDVAADWGEGSIDGQELVQRGSVELAFAVTSLVGAGALGKIVQKTWTRLPASWTGRIDDALERFFRPRPSAPEVTPHGADTDRTGRVPADAADGAPSEPGLGASAARDLDPARAVRKAVDPSGAVHEIRFGAAEVADQARWDDALDVELRDRGWTRAQFTSLVARPVHQLSAATLREVLAIRRAMPTIRPDDAIQKVVPPDQVANALGPARFGQVADDVTVLRVAQKAAAGNASRFALTSVGGYVSRAADVTGMDTAALYRKLGLNYERSDFAPDESMFTVRYQADDIRVDGSMVAPGTPNGPLDLVDQAQYLPATDGISASRFEQIASVPDADARAAAWKALATERGLGPEEMEHLEWALGWEDPYRGNGWSGDGPDYTPEWAYADRHGLPDGAEMWVTRPDGTEELVARFDDKQWIQVREQP